MKIGIETTEQPMASAIPSCDSVSKHEQVGLSFDIDDESFGSLGSDDSSWIDSDDESLLEIEERLHEFSHIGTTPALADMVFNTADFKLAIPRSRDTGDNGSVQSGKYSIASDTKLSKIQKESLTAFAMRRSNSDQFIQKGSNTSLMSTNTNANTDTIDKGTKPDDCLQNILEQQGISMPQYSAEFISSFMLHMAEENYAAYGKGIATAVRSGNLDAVKEHVNSGRTLQCCNKFRESVMHLVCRRGHADMLKYMLDETDVSPCIQDDIGRTPLHELAWTDTPNFEMVKLVLMPSPELLYVKDSRGFTPLSYVGRNNWEKWCEFLESNRDIVGPRKL